MSRPKLVYVLPTYDQDSSEHLYHIYGFLEAVGEECDVLLVIERAHGNPQFRKVRVHQRLLQVPFLGSLEVLWVLLWARLHGYRRFYVHYSISAAILTALVTRTLGGECFYWNCGHPLDFVPSRIRSVSDLRTKLRNQYLLGFALHLVHHLVTGTETMARYYSEGYGLSPESVRVLPNWVDLARFRSLLSKETLRAQLGWRQEDLVVLFLHRLAERKGAHLIAPIAHEVIDSCTAWASQLRFVVVGDGPYRDRLAAEVEQTNLKEHVLIVGAVPNREAIRYLAAADVYMMPSLEEGFPRTLIEAMAAGCPFTAADVGGVRDILTAMQARYVVPREDWHSMATALGYLLSNPELRDQLAQEGRTQVVNFSQEKVVHEFVELVVSTPQRLERRA